ncbi:MAG: IS4 family transposase [Bacteroidota bacterium]
MNQGKYVFSQLMGHVPKYEFKKCVQRYSGDHYVKSFSCWSQFLCMVFGQLTHRESLRDIITCLQAQGKKLFNLGFRGPIARSTLSDANQSRDWRIYADLAQVLIAQARNLCKTDSSFEPEIKESVYALDATTIDLCLSVFKWARFRKKKGAIKLHTMMDLRGDIPVLIHISDGLVHDVNLLKTLEFEAGAIYLMDRGYLNFEQLYRIHRSGAFFVIRAKSNLKFRRQYSQPKDTESNIVCDQIGRLTGFYSQKAYPIQLRRVKVKDPKTDKAIVILTNNRELSATIIADLYKYRWKIELFFKWIKQNLRIKVFWGESPNAVKTQVWIAVATYLLVVIIKERLKIDRPIYEILQILSVSTFDKTPLNELLMITNLQFPVTDNANQLNIFDL